MSVTLEQLISEILSGDGLTLSQAAHKLVPHRGSSVAPSTIWRWYQSGVVTPSGQRVHLELARVGAKWMTSVAAMSRFIAASTPAAPTDHIPSSPTPTATKRQRDADCARKMLETNHGF